MPGRSAKRNKYNAVKSEANGITFDSKAERDYYLNCLLPLAETGQISELQCHPQLHLSDARVGYKPDFCFIEKQRPVFVDVKGVIGERFRVIMKLWRAYGYGPLRVVKRIGSSNNFKTVKEIMPEVGKDRE